MPDSTAPVSTVKLRWTLLGTVSFAALLTAMTASVINIALPDMAREFAIDPSRAAWIILSFLLTVTVLLLVAGRLGDMFGAGRVYLTGFVIFGIGSLACALAPTEATLIVSRVVQATGSALVTASSPALLVQSVPSNRRGFAMGLMSTAVYIGLSIGPPIGGELMRVFGWRSIFYAMAAAFVIVLLIGLRSLPLAAIPRTKHSFDYLGAAMIGVGNVSFLLVCSRVPAWGWTHPLTVTLALTSVVLAPLFVLYELRHPSPTVDPRLFRSSMFSSATAATMINYTTLFLAMYLLPFALRDGQGLDASRTAQVLAAQAVGMAVFAFASGWLSDKIGSRWLAAGGMMLLAAGLAGLAWMWPTTGHVTPALWMFVCGAGTGIFVTPNSSALMGAAPKTQQGTAGAIMGLGRSLGMALGVAIGSAMFATVFPSGRVEHWPQAADNIVRYGLLAGVCASVVASIVSFAGYHKPARR